VGPELGPAKLGQDREPVVAGLLARLG
jgi:hypothetical protein